MAIVYDYVALETAYTVVRVVSFCVALTFWILYVHEILFRSGKIRTQWLKRGFLDLLLMLFIALVSSLFFILLSDFQPTHPRVPR
jgi:hypothetical protein